MTDSSPADSSFASPSQPSLFEDLSSVKDQATPSEAKRSRAGRGVPRVKRPVRDQIEWQEVCLDDLVSSSDPVRVVWAFVMAQDLSSLYDKIAAVEGEVGRDAIDPRILMALWLFATIEGIGSAREIVRRTQRDNPFRWLCGGVSVNRTCVAHFRTCSTELLDAVLTNSVAVLMQQGLVTLKRVAQDGVRVRASAGKSSFRRELTLQELQAQAREQVAALKTAADEQPSESAARQKAARERAAQDREDRIAKALAALPELAATREKRKKGDGAKTRVSTTDPEARTMKMANGGFNPAFNVQFATDTKARIIVGVDVNNEGSDAGLLEPMVEQMQQRHDEKPEEILADGGYAKASDIIALTNDNITIYTPVREEQSKREKGIDPFAPMRGDSPAEIEWRRRMGRPESQQIYRERASTAEWVNALARNRGLQQFRVRGLKKVKAVAMWYAIVHNLFQTLALGGKFA